MDFRAIPSLFVSRAIRNIQGKNGELLRLQEQIQTGSRLQRPSNDPVAMQKLMKQRLRDQGFDTRLENMQSARAKLDESVSHLLEANNVLVSAKQSALAANSFEDAEALASEVDALLQRLLAIANANDGDRYLFSGAAVHTRPFEIQNDPSGLEEVAYVGAPDRALVPLGGATAHVSYTGREVFQQRQRGQTVFISDTGAAAGTGTDSSLGQGTLQVRHASTTYGGGAGVTAGVSSAEGDTILGPAGAHSLTIDNGTLSLNGGAAIPFDGSENDLLLTGPHGEVVYVDTTGIAAGFNGNVPITADGTLSVDGGQTEVPITYGENQLVSHASSGGVTNVDSSSIRHTGDVHLEYEGTSDAFQTLRQLRDDLRNTRDLPVDQWHEAITRRIESLDRIREGLVDVIGQQSVELENISAMEHRTQDVQLDVRRRMGELGSVDIAEVVIQFQQEQNLLQFTLASSTSVFDQSLLDFIQ